MSRRFPARVALALSLVLGAGCQDYNFNPVGHCLIQPGTRRVTLSNLSTADVLFVVDDSGSMGAEQGSIAGAFNAFIQNLDQANAARAAAGLEPFDFHIAVTSTSVFWNYQTGQTCSSSCPGAAGQLVCCAGSTPARQPRACTSDAQCTVANTFCRTDCTGFKGEGYCCATNGSFPAGSISEVIPCSRDGATCGTFEHHYNFPGGCSVGVAVNQWPYPRGDFVSWSDPPGSGTRVNPRVLHFDKQLYTGTTNRQGFTRQDLVNFFAGNPVGTNANVITGTCGSGEEQGLSAARLALEKAVAGQQRDTYSMAAGKQVTWDATTRAAGSQAEWLHPSSKLVLVFIGDEDDCSSPDDPAAGIVMGAGGPGADACVDDATTPAPNGNKRYDVVTRFVDYFTGLGRPLGAAFIESAAQTSCSGLDPALPNSCTPGQCCQMNCPTAGTCGHDSQCGGQASANRFFQAAGLLKSRGADVVAGSICDPDFGALLTQIAELVKPPSTLPLPSMPAESAITLLRIADSSGQTRKVCGRPLAPRSPTNYTLQEAQDAVDSTGAHYDWWFASGNQPGPPVALSMYIYINPKGSCIANPGETYSADYLGRVPATGCQSDLDCKNALGGQTDSWTCYAGVNAGGVCVAPTVASPGTCLCGGRSQNCPNG